MKAIIIATEHSENMQRRKGKSIEIELRGGSPYFAYLWIDDKCHIITKERNFAIKKVTYRNSWKKILGICKR